MKTQFLTFLLGIFVAISFAATSTNLLTVRPASPKYTVVFNISEGSESAVSKIRVWIKKGYIVKSVSGTSSSGYTWIVVMEKY